MTDQQENWQAKVLEAKKQALNMRAQDYQAHILQLEQSLKEKNLLGLKIPYEKQLNPIILDCLYHTGFLKRLCQDQINIAKSAGLPVVYQGINDIEVQPSPDTPIDWAAFKNHTGQALKDYIAFQLASESATTKQAVYYTLTHSAF